MKKLFLLLLISTALSLSVSAQYQREFKAKLRAYAAKQSKIRTHHGFYMRAGLGATFGTIKISEKLQTRTTFSTGEVKGAGALLDLQIGAVIGNDQAITGDIINNEVLSPKVTANGHLVKTSDSLTIGAISIGIGITDFFMPQNFYFSGTIGTGTFTFQDGNQGSRSSFGFSAVIRVGKSWWISKSLGMRVNVSYYHLDAKTEDKTATEQLSCNRFLLTATFSLH